MMRANPRSHPDPRFTVADLSQPSPLAEALRQQAVSA
jgi:hypothetical protein